MNEFKIGDEYPGDLTVLYEEPRMVLVTEVVHENGTKGFDVWTAVYGRPAQWRYSRSSLTLGAAGVAIACLINRFVS